MKIIHPIFLLSLICNLVIGQENVPGLNIPFDTSYTVYQSFLKIKDRYPEAKPAYPSLPKGVVEERNLVYTTLPETPFGKRDLHVDIFRPEKQGKYPALILVHGGGWISGNKSMQVPMAQKIAAYGFVTVAVEYQLALEAKYPAAIHNLKAAIRWMRANAEKYNVDPERIFISGCSAGGNLAAQVGMTNNVEKFEGDMGYNSFSSSVCAIIDIDGIVDFLAPGNLNLERDENTCDVVWFGGSFFDKPGVWKDASPIFWANENSVPVLFLNSGYFRFHAGQNELIGMMDEWGIYTEVHKIDVKIHPFWLFNPWLDETVKYMVGFMEKIKCD